ncbi:glycosyltransferase [Paenibacillus ihuae]|uniref:glycosyltransferase n=1 Tax=Paenibacillus ihuae TaxID=1232431 RepID=UPI0006D5738F|nr:glycosyltransferase [Paenibacillus ihuae]
MKILQINSVCGFGSTGKIVTDIHESLIINGFDSYVGYGRGEPRHCSKTIKIGNKYDTYGHVAKTRLTDQHGFGSKRATKTFIKKIQEKNPDLIHLHNIHGYYLNIGILFDYLKKANKPVVWTLHDCWPFTGHCAYFDYEGCGKWKQGCYDCPQKANYPSSFLIDNSKSNYFKKKEIFGKVNDLNIITPSKWLAELLNESFLSEYNITTINNGIDLELFKPRISEFRNKYQLKDKFVILGVASFWEKRKGLDYFVQLSKILDENYKIVLIGLKEKEILDLPKNIIALPRTQNIEELAEVYTAVDVFVNPTLEDNFPTTNLESLACGTPVITFNTGGSIESINEKCGLIVKNNEINELYQCILQIQKNTKQYYSKYCLSQSLNFNKMDVGKKYISIYKSLIEKGS